LINTLVRTYFVFPKKSSSGNRKMLAIWSTIQRPPVAESEGGTTIRTASISRRLFLTRFRLDTGKSWAHYSRHSIVRMSGGTSCPWTLQGRTARPMQPLAH